MSAAGGAMLSRRAQTGLRNLQTVGMDEVTTAVWKATTDDMFEAKEKHVAAIVRWAGEPGARTPLAAALVKRVQSCGARPVTAAKTLFLLHRLALAGADEALRQPLRELASLIGRRALPGSMLGYGSYVIALCAWDDASVFQNGDAPAFWRCMHLSQLLAGLPALQGVLEAALCLALETRDVDSAAQASLHLAVAEDALGLFQCEVAAAAGLWDGLLALPPEVADKGGAIVALQAAGRHAEDVLMLQRALGSWMGGSGALASPTRLPGLIETQLPWSGHRAQAAAAAAAAAGAAAAAVARAPAPSPTVSALSPPVSTPSPPVSSPSAAAASPPAPLRAAAGSALVSAPPQPASAPAACAIRPLALSPSLPAAPHVPPRGPSGGSTGLRGEVRAGAQAERVGSPYAERSETGASAACMVAAAAVPALCKEQLEFAAPLPPPKPLNLAPLQRHGSSSGAVSAEWSAAGLLPPAPVSPPPMLPPLHLEMSASQLRVAAYEALLLGAAGREQQRRSVGQGSVTGPGGGGAARGGRGSGRAACGGSRSVTSRAAVPPVDVAGEEELAAVRTRLGITLRTHRRLLALLNLDPALPHPDAHGPSAGCPAHRARLLLCARPSATGGAAPAPADVRAFCERQALLLANAVAAAGAPAADARRLRRQVTALVEARCAAQRGEQALPDAASPCSDSAAASHAPADTTNPFLDPVFVAVSEARHAAADAAAEAEASVQSEQEAERLLRQTLAELGVLTLPGGGAGALAADAAVAWPPALAARLYCCLLGACFESSDAGTEGFVAVTSDAPAVRAALCYAWGPALPLDAAGAALCGLIVAFERYAAAEGDGAGLLAGPVRQALDEAIPRGRAALEAAGGVGGGAVGAEQAAHSSPAMPAVADGPGRALAVWGEESLPQVLAGVVAFLGGKLRDYRGHYAIDVSEMKIALGVWAEVRGRGREGGGRGEGGSRSRSKHGVGLGESSPDAEGGPEGSKWPGWRREGMRWVAGVEMGCGRERMAGPVSLDGESGGWPGW
jgi:hypothetical protein